MKVETGEGRKAVEVITTKAIVRNPIRYPRVPGHHVLVESGVIPLYLRIGEIDSIYTLVEAKFRYYFAYDVGAVGLPMSSALWTCSEMKLTHSDRSVEVLCEGPSVNPFGTDATDWWQVNINRRRGTFPEEFRLRGEMQLAESEPPVKMSTSCKHLKTVY